MHETELLACLAALEAAERMLVDAGDFASTVHVSMAIDRLRVTYRLPPRPIEPGLLWLIEEDV